MLKIVRVYINFEISNSGWVVIPCRNNFKFTKFQKYVVVYYYTTNNNLLLLG